jgi:hypothetical protein
MSSRRADELSGELEELADRLLNLPALTSPSERLQLEDRQVGLEERLHRERLELWHDLAPLAREARDAAVEHARVSWLNEIGRSLGGERYDRQ